MYVCVRGCFVDAQEEAEYLMTMAKLHRNICSKARGKEAIAGKFVHDHVLGALRALKVSVKSKAMIEAEGRAKRADV